MEMALNQTVHVWSNVLSFMAAQAQARTEAYSFSCYLASDRVSNLRYMTLAFVRFMPGP